MNTKNFALALVGSLALLGSTTGHASNLDAGNLLVTACTSGTGGDIDEAFEDVMEVCNLKATSADDDHSACDIISNDPDSCATLTVEDGPTYDCMDSSSEFTIDASLDLPSGWGMSASLSAEMSVEGEVSNREKCRAERKNAKGSGGKYVSMTGDLRVSVSFSVSGSGTVSGPGGVSFEVNGSQSCDLGVARSVHRTSTVKRCKKSECLVEADYMGSKEETATCYDDYALSTTSAESR